MSKFVITESGIAEVQRRFLLFGYDAPIARLYEKTDVSDMFNDLRSTGFLASRADEEIRAIAKERISAAGALRSSIEVGVCERKEFRSEDLIQVGDLVFVMGKDLCRMLDGCSLTFQDGRFMLLDAQGASQTLTSLAKRLAMK